MTSTPLLQLHHYQGVRQQPLHRVLVYAPTIIWVKQGHKQLWWQDSRLSVDKQSWLLIPAGHQLTFVNYPDQGQFSAHVMSLLTPPPPSWLTDPVPLLMPEPRLALNAALTFCFELTADMANRSLSEETQIQLIYGLYAELRAVNALGMLFPSPTMTLSERLARHLSVAPGDPHTLAMTAHHFAMSRASLVRKLTAEGNSFRQLLTQVRMSHALTLLQQRLTPLAVALACGYDSPSRFAARFKQAFGLTPHQYLRTCPPPEPQTQGIGEAQPNDG
ncbi:helix-turn-helix transcriptional regulator [Aeromonas cavernicola]|uniref:AraC family transcriptional regulator n=1 Tax=Aeromonas cavernicola TaxID=1006623 RepID=A0A2H9U9B5_9GAMM|nr:helix-turn-helix transcriptional regulator [Aeromonas cavernicola]PJG60579.1 AraC family transcriptional regulator [Aeromonas cavernicola]